MDNTLRPRFRPTKVEVRREMVYLALTWVCNRVAYTFDRGSMNPRSITEKIDDGVMGEIASVAVMQFLSDNGRHVVAYDQIRQDQYRDPDPGWDILSSKQDFKEWVETSGNIKIKPAEAYSFSIKSSRIPEADKDDIDKAINRRDFKIFKKLDTIDLDLSADFEVQVYYSLAKSHFNSQFLISPDDIKSKKIDIIIDKLQLMERYSECFLSGAASRETIISYSQSLTENKRFWSSFHKGFSKQMWNAPLSLGVSFETLFKNS